MELLRYFVYPKGVGTGLMAEQPLQDKSEEQNKEKEEAEKKSYYLQTILLNQLSINYVTCLFIY